MTPRIAICHHATAGNTEALALAAEYEGAAGIEITVDPDHPEAAIAAAREIASRSDGATPVRFHFPLGSYELGAGPAADSERALESMMRLVTLIGTLGGGQVTVHAPLGDEHRSGAEFDATADRLKRLVDHARPLGVEVCLENLRWGATSDPQTFARLATIADTRVTFDVGHAVSSDADASGFSAQRFVELVADRIVSAHVYGYETEGHHPPEDLERIGPALGALLDAGCGWWTIELIDHDEIRSTRALLTGFLKQRYASKEHE